MKSHIIMSTLTKDDTLPYDREIVRAITITYTIKTPAGIAEAVALVPASWVNHCSHIYYLRNET